MGVSFQCAVRAGGAAVCWGVNTWGQLGDGTTTDRRSPVAVLGLTDVTQIAPGWSGTCARRRGGEVHCWGYQSNGDGTGDPNVYRTVRPGPAVFALP